MCSRIPSNSISLNFGRPQIDTYHGGSAKGTMELPFTGAITILVSGLAILALGRDNRKLNQAAGR